MQTPNIDLQELWAWLKIYIFWQLKKLKNIHICIYIRKIESIYIVYQIYLLIKYSTKDLLKVLQVGLSLIFPDNEAFRHVQTLFVQGSQVRTDPNKPLFVCPFFLVLFVSF